MKVFPALLCGVALLALGYYAAGSSGKDEQAESRSYRSLDECLADAASLGDRQLCKDTYDAVMSDTTAVPTFQNQSACEGEFSAGGCRQVSNSSLWGPLLTGFMISRAMDHRRPVYSAMPLYKQWQEQPRQGGGSWWPSSHSSVPYTSSSSSSSRPSSSSYSPSSFGSSSSSSSWFGSRSSRSTDAVPPTTSGKDGSTSTSSPRSSTSAWGISSTPKASNDNSSVSSSSRKSSPVGIASPSVSRGGFGSSASSSASRGG